MNKRKFSIILFILFSSLSLADDPKNVPEKLFGITLGNIYNIGDYKNKEIGNLPIKKFAGIEYFGGVHYYFQPQNKYKIFEYIEKREKPDDQYFKTSFSLYLLPSIPSITLTDKTEKLNWEVAIIRWSDEAKTTMDAYYWAADLCKTFKVDISVKPIISDSYDSKTYECIFSSGNREFKVSSLLHLKTIRLSYKNEVLEEKTEVIETIIRKKQANEIRPY